jgi:hypothetical protein
MGRSWMPFVLAVMLLIVVAGAAAFAAWWLGLL